MPPSNLTQLSWHLAVLVAAELGLWIAYGGMPAQAADHWVGTWSTAEVGRPQSPLPPAPLVPPRAICSASLVWTTTVRRMSAPLSVGWWSPISPSAA
jgi:hypothetical protein